VKNNTQLCGIEDLLTDHHVDLKISIPLSKSVQSVCVLEKLAYYKIWLGPEIGLQIRLKQYVIHVNKSLD
jgi:hypothetical protein